MMYSWHKSLESPANRADDRARGAPVERHVAHAHAEGVRLPVRAGLPEQVVLLDTQFAEDAADFVACTHWRREIHSKITSSIAVSLVTSSRRRFSRWPSEESPSAVG